MSVKVECLDRFQILGSDHFDYIVSEHLEHYHAERPHQGIANRLIVARAPPETTKGSIVCSNRLGGMLKSYHRQSA